MKRSIVVCCALAFCGAGIVSATVPPKLPGKVNAAAVAGKEKGLAGAKNEANSLDAAQDRAVANYERNMSRKAAAAKREQAKIAAAAAAMKKQAGVAAAAEAKAKAGAKRERDGRAAQLAKKEAQALARAQDRVVAYYKRSLGIGTDTVAAKPVKGIEKLACFTGVQDRHARIGVQLVNGKVDYFAYYSKWKPRTCSIAAERNGPYSHWEENGGTLKVTLVDNKGAFTIDRKGGSYRFVFRNIDRMRYCGMSGKINGSLTVMRGKSTCVVQGVMDGPEG
jgi:hypothetical protein